MRNIFRIFKKDIKDIFSNYALLIVITGLCILPSLYAWFNIEASWDPYGSTGNISVAVVNKDKGSSVFDKDVNVGDELISNLKENTNLGWQFVDDKTARKGVENGTYYASIEIPENFSKDLTSLLTSDVKKGEIIYTVNEKINAIAPKITDKGASTIQLEVNETVVKTVSETIFEVFNKVGVNLEDQLPKLQKIETSLVEVQQKFGKITKTVDLASDATSKIGDIIKEVQGDMPAIKTTLENSKKLSGDVKTFLTDTQKSMDEISPIIKTDIGLIANVSSNISSSIKDLIDIVNKGGDVAPELINSLEAKLSNLSHTTKTLLDFLKKIDKITPGNLLKNPIAQLESIYSSLQNAISGLDIIKNQIANGQQPSLDTLNKILTVANDVNNIANNIYNNFDEKIAKPINDIFAGGLTVASNVIDVLEKAEAKLPAIEDILNTSLDFSGNAQEILAFIQEKLPEAKTILDELVSTISKINSSEEINDLVDLLKNDIVTQSEFLKEPVELTTNKLYPVANYGSSMTPFYTVLSLWVGVLLLVSILTTEVHGDYRPSQIYFGRGLTFVTLAIIQSFIVSVGDIWLLGVQVVDPVLFILISIFTSVVFTFIVYSLVSVFGNIGKAVAIVLLVIQVAGSGGTFPIEVTPRFFQILNPLLPFTHAIRAMRESVAGVYEPNLAKSMTVLLIFLVASVLVNVLLKGPINKLLSKFTHKFNSSDLIGH